LVDVVVVVTKEESHDQADTLLVQTEIAIVTGIADAATEAVAPVAAAALEAGVHVTGTE